MTTSLRPVTNPTTRPVGADVVRRTAQQVTTRESFTNRGAWITQAPASGSL